MAHNQVTLHFETSDDMPDVPDGRNHDLLSGMLGALALEFTPDGQFRRYLEKLSEVHRARAEAVIKKLEPKPKKIKKVAGVRKKHSRDGVIRCEICSPMRCSKAP